MAPTLATTDRTPGAAASAEGAGRRTLWIIFGVALLVRLAYTLATYAALGPDGLLAPDSQSYLTKASQFVDAARAGALSGWDWLGPDTGLMPMVIWFLGAAQALTGAVGPLAPALLQGGIDALTCVVIAQMAATLDPRLASPAGWFAALTPTLIVMSGLVLTDSLFLLASAVSLLAALRWLRHQGWRWAIVLGVALGCAALTRVVILPWAVAVTVGLGCAVVWQRQLAWAYVAQLGIALAVALALFAPVPARNLDRYDSYARTSQTGSVLPSVSTTSAMGRSFSRRCMAMRVVSVAIMLAFTPLPRPSERARVTESRWRETATLSPHSSSLCLCSCFMPHS